MGALSVVVRDEFRQHRSKVLLVHDDEMVQAVSAECSDDLYVERCCCRSRSAVARVRQSDHDWVQEPVREPGRRTHSLRARTVAWALSPHRQVRAVVGQSTL